MVIEVIPSAAGKSAIKPANHRTNRIRPFLARMPAVLLEKLGLFIRYPPHSVDAEHPKDDTAAPDRIFHEKNTVALKDRAELERDHLGDR